MSARRPDAGRPRRTRWGTGTADAAGRHCPALRSTLRSARCRARRRALRQGRRPGAAGPTRLRAPRVMTRRLVDRSPSVGSVRGPGTQPAVMRCAPDRPRAPRRIGSTRRCQPRRFLEPCGRRRRLEPCGRRRPLEPCARRQSPERCARRRSLEPCARRRPLGVPLRRRRGARAAPARDSRRSPQAGRSTTPGAAHPVPGAHAVSSECWRRRDLARPGTRPRLGGFVRDWRSALRPDRSRRGRHGRNRSVQPGSGG
ncbi:MAG: hypothetical protein JWP39_3484 [Jatrophihabitans sp.]|nr:hypothetical protein [Jatrophihabitans sp.]